MFHFYSHDIYLCLLFVLLQIIFESVSVLLGKNLFTIFYILPNICSHGIKRHLIFGRKVMANLDSIFKSRNITLPTKVRLVKAMVFPVVMYGCESWAVKKAECQRTDASELWWWRRVLRIPWTARRSNHSNQKESNPEYSLERLMLILQYFGHLI